MVLRFLGESVTDSNGLAVLPDGYTGTGAGEVDIIAKTVIDDSTIQSEPYTVWDYIKYDYGTDSNHNDIWTALHMGTNLTRNTDYSTIDEGTSEYAEYRVQIPNADCIIELDIKNNGSTGWVTSICQGTTISDATQLTGFGVISMDTWTHLKLVIEGTTIKAYYNNETTPRVTRTNIVRDTSKVLCFAFTTPQAITTIDFKDFKVYPI